MLPCRAVLCRAGTGGRWRVPGKVTANGRDGPNSHDDADRP
ncbi:hypothetical protein [Streptomyces tubercidicus]